VKSKQYEDLKTKFENYQSTSLKKSTSSEHAVGSVVEAITQGNFSKSSVITGNVDLQNNSNALLDLVHTFLVEVSRVTDEMNRGKFGSQIQLPMASGEWKTCVEQFNTMSANLYSRFDHLSQTAQSLSIGNFSKLDWKQEGQMQELANSLNGVMDQLEIFSSQMPRVTQGQHFWQHLAQEISDTHNAQLSAIAHACDSVRAGRLDERISVDMHQATKQSVNTMINDIETLVTELTRLTYEIGAEGKLGGQAQVLQHVPGAWKQLIDNTNSMAATHSVTVRSVQEAITEPRKISAQWAGEAQELQEVVNNMVDAVTQVAERLTRLAAGENPEPIAYENVEGVWRELILCTNHLTNNTKNKG
jgi:methyl-accepting chemotaxis protein